jgi:hypothetical protein
MPESTSTLSRLIDPASIAITVVLIVSLVVRGLASVAGPRFAPLVRALNWLVVPLLVAFGVVVVYRLVQLSTAR